MFSKELENLIQATLEDGMLEEYEKAALVKRAQAEGVDLTELEIYINSILQKRKRESEEKKNAEYAKIEKIKKEEIGKVCPKCGRQVPSLALNCECGYEFKKEKNESAVKLLAEKLEEIQKRKLSLFGEHGDAPIDKEKLRQQELINTITMFPIPNTKEDIMEFLALALPNSKKIGGLTGTLYGRIVILVILFIISILLTMISADFEILIGIVGFGGLLWCTLVDQDIIKRNGRANAWRTKFEQTLMKGRSLRADEEFTKMLEYYENEMKLNDEESKKFMGIKLLR